MTSSDGTVTFSESHEISESVQSLKGAAAAEFNQALNQDGLFFQASFFDFFNFFLMNDSTDIFFVNVIS